MPLAMTKKGIILFQRLQNQCCASHNADAQCPSTRPMLNSLVELCNTPVFISGLVASQFQTHKIKLEYKGEFQMVFRCK